MIEIYCEKLIRYKIISFIRLNENALGATDPREVKDYLAEKGIDCWLDIEQSGKVYIYL